MQSEDSYPPFEPTTLFPPYYEYDLTDPVDQLLRAYAHRLHPDANGTRWMHILRKHAPPQVFQRLHDHVFKGDSRMTMQQRATDAVLVLMRDVFIHCFVRCIDKHGTVLPGVIVPH
jgi:hypothetical protein